ncbi:MAG TPA: molybdenum cofactor biosynthesis protein MoaE [Pirellulales bacterium]|jgi:molybdopterin synthase catalytic subunit|nr:molybdenum cofactor biosynthesis protein MoaE [Pirellulales bacterium]
MVELTMHPIDPARLLEFVASPKAGASVLFLGSVRDSSEGLATQSLDYECYPQMAEKLLAELESEARARWPLESVAIVHRLGHLAVGETSVAVAVSSPHRAEAFEAGRWLIDTLKVRVPIWKRENRPDGTGDWVHPGVPASC